MDTKNNKKLTGAGMIALFLRGSKRWFALNIACSTVGVVLSFLLPRIIGYAVDTVIGGGEPADLGSATTLMRFTESVLESFGIVNALITCAVAVAVCGFFTALMSFLARVTIANASETFVKTARDSMYAHTQMLPFKWHTEHQTGDVIQRCTSDVETVRRFVSQQLIQVLQTIIMLTTALYVMFSINVPLTLVVVAILPLVFGYSIFLSKRVSREFRLGDEAEGALTIDVQENLTGVRVVRAFGRIGHEAEKFKRLNNELAEKWIQLGKTLGVFWGIGDAVSSLTLLAVLAIGSVFAANGTLSLGELLVFINCAQRVAWPVRAMGRTISEMSKAVVSVSRLLEILCSEAESEPQSAKKPPMNGDIEFHDVSFAYAPPENAEVNEDNRAPYGVLRGVNLKIPGGTTLGILGATGSGKSTLTYLLTRLFDVQEGNGKITIGGVDIREIDRFYLRENVGLVLQEPFLFSKTIAENIAVTKDGEPNMDDVRAKSRIASIDEDILAFEEGYGTKVGERGVTLSGGQKQRVAIARTLMTGAPVMIFDDSMSALDMETDQKIRDGLRTGTGGATVIIISHRVSTLMTADNIAVMEGGRVVEYGSHRELVAKNGIYKRVYDIQSVNSKAVNG